MTEASESFLRCDVCDGIVAIARVHGDISLVCHCTHVDGRVERPTVDNDVSPPESWGWA